MPPWPPPQFVTHTVTTVLPNVVGEPKYFVVRGVHRKWGDSSTPCPSGSTDDKDDLLFLVLPNKW